MRSTLRAVAVGSAILGLSRSAHAAVPTCASLGAQPIVYVENGDTQEPLVKRLGQKLLASASPVRLVYKNRRTCDLALDLYTGALMMNDAIAVKYIPAPDDPNAVGWNPSMPTPACTVAAGGVAIDLGIGATYLSSCPSLPAMPATLAQQVGPVQSYGFIVPKGSAQIAMTAQEGYFAFGFPQGTGQATPWLDQALRITRGPTASTALTCAAAIGVPASKLKGTVPTGNTSTEVLNAVATSTSFDATIGLMGTEVYDANRDKVKLLAFKGYGQRYAYYPDFGATSFDKKNVRDGHYLPWAPTPYITRVDGTGKATNASVQRILDLVVAAKAEADVSGIDEVIASGLVPQCAMGVERAFDGANLALYAPPAPCACYFDAKVAQGATKCTACTGTDDTPCGGGKCRRGYCEVR